jgi:flavin reductase (DIM6/NTAB) family NADH-FMN oxidoreductase RutF
MELAGSNEMTDDERLKADFRLAMRALASTATIVSTRQNGRNFGMAATAVTSLSTEPPSLLICVNRSASIHANLPIGGAFCINVLQPRHRDLCLAFGGKVEPEKRFNDSEWESDSIGIPRLKTAAAAISCHIANIVGHASHSIIIGNVHEVAVQGGGAPLIYGNGGFLDLASPHGQAA